MNNLKKRLMALLLSAVMLLTFVAPAMATGAASGASSLTKVSYTPVDENADLPLIGQVTDSETEESQYADTDIVRVSIVLEDKPTLQAGFSSVGIAKNEQAQIYRAKLEREQENVLTAIETKVLNNKPLDVVWNLTLAANLISANVEYGQIDKIAAISGVKEVVLEQRHEPMVVNDGDNADDPMMATSNLMSGAVEAWTNGYTGAGSRIAVIDTGIDLNHQSFASDAFEYSLSVNAAAAGMTTEEYMASLDLLDQAEVESVLDQLNVSVSASATYRGSKIPFAYNYIDVNYRVTHDYDTNGEHGSHVAGIAAAGSYIKQNGEYVDAFETVEVKGVAPDAQLLIMKVFGENGGAYTSDYMAAIEDAIILGADSVNLSLGSGSAGFSYNTTYQELLAALQETETVTTMSAGNSYSWPEHTDPEYLYREDVSFDISGSPSSYSNALAVASVDSTSYNDDGTYTEPAYYTMSDFSSWGTHGSLELKPEITAPGGNIYSVNGIVGDGKQYETMSGTSMAAPQIAGMVAVLAQYIRENNLSETTGLTVRQLATSLLMSTAKPLIERYSNSYYSLLKQGAGMAIVGNAAAAGSYILMGADATAYAADGKIKAELGEDADKTGVYQFSFTINNLDDVEKYYTLRADLFTQALYGEYLDYDTTALGAEVVFTVDGETYVPTVEAFDCDLNEDGVTDALDAKVILAAVLDGTTDALAAIADVNEDGTIDTYDAHLILANLISGTVVLEANTSVEVVVTATLTDTQKAELDDSYPNGAYVEGFVFVESVDGSDVDHSIPMLAFYGSWSDPSMFGVSYSDTLYGDEREPYFGSELNNNLAVKNSSGETTLVTGNPYMVEDSYPEGRVAICSEDLMTQYKMSLIRNAVAMRLQITDAAGAELYNSGISTYVAGAYYYVNGAEWRNTDSSYTLNLTPADIGAEEGDVIHVAITAVPEYYALGQTMTNELMDKLAAETMGKGAVLSTTMTIDDTDPKVTGVWVDEETNELVVECIDNNYVAVVALTSRDGNEVYTMALPEQTKANETITHRIALSGINGQSECLLVVGDYARNEATLKLVLDLEAGGGEGGEAPEVPADASVFAFSASASAWHSVDFTSLSYNGFKIGGKVAASSVQVIAAEYVDGYVYMVDSNNVLYVAKQSSPNNMTTVADLSSVTDVQDMAFNLVDNQMYVLGSDNTMYTMNLYTGELTKAFTISVVLTGKSNLPEACYKLYGMTIDTEGNFIVANHGGDGYEFANTYFLFGEDKIVDGAVTDLEPVLYAPYSWSTPSANYISGYTDNGISLTYDHANDRLYYFGWGRYNLNYFYIINLDTASVGSYSAKTEGDEAGHSVSAMYSLNTATGIVQPSQEATSLKLVPTEKQMTPGDTAKLSYEIGPWNLANTAVTWTTSDESVATVENGVVTAVAKGTATITATTVAAPNLTATCVVTVQEPDPLPENVDLKGLIYGADSQTYWSNFGTADPENWQSVYGPSYYYYGGTLLDNAIILHDGSDVYALDPDTFEATHLTGISSSYYWNDAAAAPAVDGCFDVIVAPHLNGTGLGLIDAYAGTVSSFDLSAAFASDPMANIALYAADTVDGQPAYRYYILTESGALYDAVIWAVEDDFDLSYTMISESGLEQPGVSAVMDGASSSMLYDAESGYLFLTSYVDGDYAYLYAIWPATGTVTELGHFGQGVWPANSLYTYEGITELTLRVRETEVSMYVGDEYATKITVLPMTLTGGVTCVSSDTSVVTVDNNGVLTGVAPGTATITVTTNDTDANGARTATIAVTVLDTMDVDFEVNGMVETKDDRLYWSKLDASDLSSYEVLHESGARVIAGGVHDKKLYVNDGTLSYFWGIIPIGYPLQIDPLNDWDINAGSIMDYGYLPADLTSLPDLAVTYVDENGDTVETVAPGVPLHNTAAGVLVIMDFEGGSVRGWEPAEDLGGYLGGLTFEGIVTLTDEQGMEHEAAAYYFLTDNGRLFRTYIYANYAPTEDPEESPFSYSIIHEIVAETGLSFADFSDMSMVLIDDGVNYGLAVAHGADLYYIDLSGDELVAGKVGAVPGAYALSALYTDAELGLTEEADGTEAVPAAVTVTGKAHAIQQFETMKRGNTIKGLLAVGYNETADGSLNAVSADLNKVEAETSVDTDTVRVVLTEDVDVTNGLISVTYDPSVLTFSSLNSTIQTNDYRVDEVNGVVTFDYAAARAITASKILAEVEFTHSATDTVMTTITVETEQRNDEAEITDEATVIEIAHHVEHFYTWTLEVEPTVDSEGLLRGVCDCGLNGCEVEVVMPALNDVDYDYEVIRTPTISREGKAVFTWKNTDYGIWAFEVTLPKLPTDPVPTPNPDLKPSKPVWENPYIDVNEDHWFYDAVEYVSINGLMNGMSATEFGPNLSTTRAMIVTILWRLEGEPVVNYAMRFSDVAAGTWYTEAVRWAASEGIVNGMSADQFAPTNNITREQMAAILYRYAQYKGYDVSADEDALLGYKDADSVSAYAVPAMKWACSVGLINGDNGSLMPKGNATRAQVATILMRFCEKIAK